MLLQNPDGTALGPLGETIAADANTERAQHSAQALSRLIERWKAENNPNLAVLVDSINAEVDELEAAIWEVMRTRLIDFAVGVQLDTLGKIVGQPREGLSDDAYRAHVRARIRINQSFGQVRDVIAVIRLLYSDPVKLSEYPIARFAVHLDAPPDPAIGHELPGLISQTRAAGVGCLVEMPVGLRGSFFGSSYDLALNAAIGHSSSYDSSIGGLFAHATRA